MDERHLSKENIISYLEQWRQDMHAMIDQECNNFLLRLNSEGWDSSGKGQVYVQRTLPLFSSPSLFKRQKPVSIDFGDGRVVPTRTWKHAVTVILQECISDPVMLNRLMDLRGNISGRQRTILSDTPDGLDIPLEITNGLYVEGKYDAETMIHVLTHRIFHAIGYDYNDIQITIRDPQHTYIPQPQVETIKKEDALALSDLTL